MVIEEVHQFGETHPDWPIYKLNVIERRELSDDVEDRLGIRHQSPQAFIIRDGSCVWNASHGDITAQALSRHLHD